MITSVLKTRFIQLAFCLGLLVAFAKCHEFASVSHVRGLKTISNCPLVYTGTDWVGGDIGDFRGGLGSASACCTHCNRNYGARVLAYIYRIASDRCYCKNRVNPPSNCQDCQGRNFFERSVPSSCNPIYNSDVAGNDLPNMPIQGVTEPGNCCTQCRANSACVAWVWRRESNRCYLKFAARNPSRCPQCVRGTP